MCFCSHGVHVQGLEIRHFRVCLLKMCHFVEILKGERPSDCNVSACVAIISVSWKDLKGNRKSAISVEAWAPTQVFLLNPINMSCENSHPGRKGTHLNVFSLLLAFFQTQLPSLHFCPIFSVFFVFPTLLYSWSYLYKTKNDFPNTCVFKDSVFSMRTLPEQCYPPAFTNGAPLK